MRMYLFVGLMAAASLARAGTHYVDNSCANNGDGTTATCASISGGAGAWNSLANVTCAGLVGGDHIQIRRGVGLYKEQAGSGAFGWNMPSACSGSSSGPGQASSPVYVENYPGENVIIDGSKDIHTSTWTAVGNGVYQCTSGTCAPAHSSSWAYMAWYVAAGGGPEQEIYTIQTSACSSSVPVGFMYIQGAAAACVHLPGDVSPSTAASFSIPYVSYGVALNKTHDLTIRRNPSGGSFSIRRNWFNNIAGSYTSNYNMTFDGLDLGYAIDRCLNIDNANFPPVYPINSSPQNNMYVNNHIHHCGQEGMHVGDDTLTTIVDNNEIDHIQIPPWFQHCGVGSCNPYFTDRGVAIRAWCFNTGNYCHIGGNIIHDSGGGHEWGKFGAINLEYGAVNTVVENNLIYNIGPMGSGEYATGTGGLGIQFTYWQTYPTCGTSSAPCTIRNNRFYNVDSCASVENGGSFYMNWSNNTCANFSDSGFQSQYGTFTGTINMVNNIFYWSPTAGQTTGPITSMLGDSNSGAAGAFANNSFYCTQGCSGTIIHWPSGSNYTSSAITSVGNNTWGDPNISMAATGLPHDVPGSGSTYAPWNTNKLPVPALYLTVASGSAYQHGQALSPSFPDFLGNARPASGAWDIGASAYTASPPACCN